MDRETGNAILKVVTNFLDPRNNMVNEDAIRVDDVGSLGTTVYVGYNKNGAADADSTWKIMKVTVVGDITTMKYPNGSKAYSYVWNNRASYTYS